MVSQLEMDSGIRSMTFSVEHSLLDETAHLAVWVFLPQGEVSTNLPSLWCLAIPGASYSGLAYFDHSATPGYSMARYLASQGIGVVVIDNLGTGASPLLTTPGRTLTREILAELYSQIVDLLRLRLIQGTLCSDLAPVSRDLWIVGVGHSMGGYILSALQALFAPFEATAFLGWTQGPWDEALIETTGHSFKNLSEQHGYYSIHDRSFLRPFFYGEPLLCSQALIKADEEAQTAIPAGLFEGLLAQVARDIEHYAAKITCPVFLSFGACGDIAKNPREEGKWYASSDVTWLLQSQAAHCANFASTRVWLWQHLASWMCNRAEICLAGKF